MFRTQYDSDITVWSPQGRIHQIEYAMEAVKQGSATVGVKNKDFAVLAALKRSASELSSHQQKTHVIDEHIGVSVAGFISDARTLTRYMQTECLNHRWSFDEPIPVSRLVTAIGNKMQYCTIEFGRRPFGVGFLVAGHDDHGSHIYQIDPSANWYACKSMAIGARSQSARTYLERHLDAIYSSDVQGLCRHALRALRECLPHEVELNSKNVTLSIVGPGQPFKNYAEDELQPFLQNLDDEAAAAAAPAPNVAPMQL